MINKGRCVRDNYHHHAKDLSMLFFGQVKEGGKSRREPEYKQTNKQAHTYIGTSAVLSPQLRPMANRPIKRHSTLRNR